MGANDPAVYIEGGRELRREFRRAGVDMTRLRDANRKAGAIAAEASRREAPIGPTGKLAGSIKSFGSQTMARVRLGKKAVPYAGPIHWGWHKRHIKPNQFVSRGTKKSEPQWLAVYTDEVRDIINSIGGKT